MCKATEKSGENDGRREWDIWGQGEGVNGGRSAWKGRDRTLLYSNSPLGPAGVILGCSDHHQLQLAEIQVALQGRLGCYLE